MITTTHALGIVAAIALVSAALRFFPALVFRGRETPQSIIYLGDVLPYAIMGMLVVYCLRETSLAAAPFGIPEAAGALAVIGLHVWKRNTLLSILAGTIVYMILIRLL
jgi:branched-subunit amino acid transport protein AzlD